MLNQFRVGQRVRVYRVKSRVDGEPISLDSSGTVVRLRRDDEGAYIELDYRSPLRGVHGFPMGDTRERQVSALPRDCDPLEDVRARP